MNKIIKKVPMDLDNPLYRPDNFKSAGKVLIVDSETNKLHGNVISIAGAFCDFNDEMDKIYINDVVRIFRQDNVPMDEDAIKFTGLTPEFLKENDNSEKIWNLFINKLEEQDIVVAHNVGYDIMAVERTWPESSEILSKVNWACSVNDIDWAGKDRDIRAAVLDYVLFKAGYYNGTPHEALADVLSLIAAVLGPFPKGDLPLTELLTNAMQQRYNISLPGLPFRDKDKAKSLKFRWNPEGKVWFKIAKSKDNAKEVLIETKKFYDGFKVEKIMNVKQVYVNATN